MIDYMNKQAAVNIFDTFGKNLQKNLILISISDICFLF